MHHPRLAPLLPLAVLAACATTHSPAQGVFRGPFTYMADAGRFTDCRTGMTLGVAHEGDNAALERAYSQARANPGDPVFVELQARVESRPPMEGPGSRPTLIVERFLRVVPGGTCSSR